MKTTKKQKNKTYILNRYGLISFFILLLAGGIIYTMFKTTVVQADKWNEKASKILSKTDTIEPERGKILADDGSILAANLHFYKAKIDWGTEGITEKRLLESIDELCDSLAAFSRERGSKKTAQQWKAELKAKYYGLDKRTLKRKKQNTNPKKDTAKFRDRSHVLYTALTHGEYMRLKSFPYLKERKNKTGFTYETYTRRCKPFGSMASRSIGIVAESRTSRTRRGVNGLERALDSLLYGIPGETKKEQLTSTIVNWEKTPAKKGYDIVTTINIDLQDILEEELYKMCKETKSDWGTAILMEVKTGKIKAISNLEWSKKAHDYIEGRNNAVLGYEPGSVMKPISMMVALEDGIVNNIDKVITTGYSYAYAGGRPITDSHGAASMPIRQVIGASSNIGMAKIILSKYEKTPGKFYSRLKELGFFEPLNTGIAGERIPRIDSLGNKNWDRIALSRMAYGYATQIPPMSTLAIYNAIANDGKYIRPRLVDKFMYNGEIDSIVPESYIREQVCSPENAAKLRTMLHDVVWKAPCTARALQNDYVEIAGKTGTCYVTEYDPVSRKVLYTNKKRLAFCGFFPYENPQYTCMVLMSGADRGAARSSGTVLMNTALRMYSRGLLGNSSDYKANNDNAVKTTTFYASKNKQDRKNLKELGINKSNSFVTPKTSEKGKVPSVIGLSAKEAVSILENNGLLARLDGAGYVVRQSVPAGSEYTSGQLINLTLRH